MSSRNGTRFHRWPDAIIPESAPKDRSGNRSNYAANGLLSLPGHPNRMSIYGTEAYYTGRDSRVRRFEYRVDGFVSVQARETPGTLVTKPLVFSGKRLLINAVTGAGGRLQVILEDSQGRPIPGYTSKVLQGDLVDQDVHWNSGNDVSPLAGKVVRIRFQLQGADLYAIRFAP